MRRKLVLVPLLLAAVGGSLAIGASPAGAATAGGVACAGESGMSWAPVSVAPQTASRTTVGSLAVERNAACDRVVFEAAGGVPGYAIRYVDAAGVRVAGGAALEIQLRNVTSVPSANVSRDYSVIRQLRSAGQRGDVATYYVGVSRQMPFLAYWLKSPIRLVIDFASYRTVQNSGSAQVTQTPTGAVQTGGGSTSGVEDSALLASGAGLIVLAGLLVPRRRRVRVRA